MEIKVTRRRYLYIVGELLFCSVLTGSCWFGVILALESRNRNAYFDVLEAAHRQVRKHAKQEEIENLIPFPPDRVESAVTTSGVKRVFYWDSGRHQGPLHNAIGYTSYKGHYDLLVSFDELGVVEDVEGGVN